MEGIFDEYNQKQSHRAPQIALIQSKRTGENQDAKHKAETVLLPDIHSEAGEQKGEGVEIQFMKVSSRHQTDEGGGDQNATDKRDVHFLFDAKHANNQPIGKRKKQQKERADQHGGVKVSTDETPVRQMHESSQTELPRHIIADVNLKRIIVKEWITKAVCMGKQTKKAGEKEDLFDLFFRSR